MFIKTQGRAPCEKRPQPGPGHDAPCVHTRRPRRPQCPPALPEWSSRDSERRQPGRGAGVSACETSPGTVNSAQGNKPDTKGQVLGLHLCEQGTWTCQFVGRWLLGLGEGRGGGGEGWGGERKGGEGGGVVYWHRVSVWEDENLEMDDEDGYTTMSTYSMPLNLLT